MKKVCSLCLLVLLSFACAVGVNAAAGVCLSGADSIAVGETVELILSVSDCPDVSSVSVDVSYGDGFEFVSGTWLKTGALTHYDTEKNKGAVGGLSSPDINGDLFKLVLKAKAASVEVQSVSITTTAKNGAEDIFQATAEKNITIVCTHTFDTWNPVSDSDHQSVCSVCGEKGEIAPHQPGEAVTDTSAQNCTDCGYELVPALGADTQETIPSVETESSIPNAGGFPWWIVIVLAVILLIGVVLIVVKKIK